MNSVHNHTTSTGVPFPKNFLSSAKTILKRLFRVYAHIYHQHFSEVVQLGEEAHLNTSFKHFIYFVQEFSLIDKRELVPLQELIDKLTGRLTLSTSNSSQSASSILPPSNGGSNASNPEPGSGVATDPSSGNRNANHGPDPSSGNNRNANHGPLSQSASYNINFFNNYNHH